METLPPAKRAKNEGKSPSSDGAGSSSSSVDVASNANDFADVSVLIADPDDHHPNQACMWTLSG